jgi:5-methylcytosine-specific restriction endonuclease McrA
MNELRICRCCEIEKPINKFERDKRATGGITNRCLQCKQSSNNRAYKAFYRLKDKLDKYPVPIETTKEEVAQLFDVFDNRCGYCGVEESEETGTFHLEHIRPLARGGGHHVSNLFISCRNCNFRKSDRPILTFYRDHGRFDYYYLPFLVQYIARFSKRSVEEVESDLIEDEKAYESSRGVAAG